ncbi:non-specific serine/threonine protein kinase [Salvia divinorum]|uniref:Non-specific serine/threonine protein kinase n=1 Tax=Salvia divinorum TaxID=28513 RepID=A0ABD1GCZ6_SALDI
MKSSTSDTLCRRFSLAELNLATEDFSDKHVIGKGGYGKVYKGFVDNNRPTAVAIKRRLASDPSQGHAEFAAEIETLTKFGHRNLVSLVGYCHEDEEMILVYDYMSKGTLADHLHNQSTLSWIDRLKICIGAGRAKVSDFGLAKHLGHDILQSHVFTNVKGSFGYFDPSYFTTGRLTRASDTYAFGVILLEVLSGRPAVEEKLAEDEVCMSIWAQEKIRNGKADQIVASNLKGDISEDCLKTFVGVVKRCLHLDPKKRLTMTRVVGQLELALEQQEGKGTTSQTLPFWPFRNRAGSTPKDQNVVEVEATEKGVPFVLFGETKGIFYHAISPMYNGFRGVLKNGEDATIQKVHYMPNHEFIAEVSRPLSMLKHENVVELVVYNLDGLEQVLAYDFAPQGSLHDILHEQQGIGSSSKPYPALSWSQRIQIALGVARGICYVHSKGLIHHNIRSSNVLLCDDETAKIIDPLLWTKCLSCRQISMKECHPILFNIHTKKIDVYNFGEILLELLTGSKIVDNTRREEGQHHLVSWALPQLDSDKVHKIVDARLKADHLPTAVKMMARVAQLCLQGRDSSMREVVRDLKLCLRKTKWQHSWS